MSLQNLVSSLIAPELKTSLLTRLNVIKTDIAGFVISLLPTQKKEVVKVGNAMFPFIEKIHDAVNVHPEILPAIFDKAEYEKDYALSKDLTPINNVLKEVASSVDDTLFAVNSDLMVQSLEIYAAIQQHKNKVPGLDVVAGELSEFFKRTRTVPVPEPPVPQPTE